VRLTEAATNEEIDSIIAAPAFARWSPGLLAIGGLILLAVGFYGGSRSGAEPGDEAQAGPVEAASGSGQGTYLALGEDPRPAIAVLPFDDMSAQADQESFSDGMSTEIVTVLSKIRELRVAARSSAFAYRARDLDLRQVGDELGVPYILDGDVRKDGDRVRIGASLVSVSDGSIVWSDTYERRYENIFLIQSEIATAIAEALRIPLGLSQDALVSPTRDMAAYDLYLSGRTAQRRRGPGVGEAIRVFEAAIAKDSLWAPAWAALAEAYSLSPLYTGSGGESTDSVVWARSFDAAERAAQRALELDPRNASARVALASTLSHRWEWGQAETEVLLALDLDPDNSEAHIQYAELLWGVGRLDESMRETGRALALDRAPITLNSHGYTLLMNGFDAVGEALLEEAFARDPTGEVHYVRPMLAELALYDGRYQEAIDRFDGYLPEGYRQMGEALAAGDPSLLPETGGRGFAQTLVLLGEYDRALDVLEARVFFLPFRVAYEIWHPLLAPIWDTPRFQNVILPRVHLEGVTPSFASPSQNN